MYTENGLIADLDEVRTVIAEADVFGIGFRVFAERLLVDSRTNPQDGPFIGVVAPLSGVQERMFWLGQQRPRFGMPRRFAFFFWPNSLRFVEETGIWQAVRDRVLASGHPGAEADTARAIADLRRLEYAAIVDAVSGENHRTLWQSEAHHPNR
jgi:hypothetical protein